jgi:class 3 adenylate cyclase
MLKLSSNVPSETSNVIHLRQVAAISLPLAGAKVLGFPVLHKAPSQELRGRDRSMLPKPESACFVIADISGYTGFLAGVELEHAQDIIADVMDTMVRRLRPPFRLAKFEGDAAFFYAVADKVDGSVLQDAVEAAYFAFRKRLRNIS